MWTWASILALFSVFGSSLTKWTVHTNSCRLWEHSLLRRFFFFSLHFFSFAFGLKRVARHELQMYTHKMHSEAEKLRIYSRREGVDLKSSSNTNWDYENRWQFLEFHFPLISFSSVNYRVYVVDTCFLFKKRERKKRNWECYHTDIQIQSFILVIIVLHWIAFDSWCVNWQEKNTFISRSLASHNKFTQKIVLTNGQLRMSKRTTLLTRQMNTTFFAREIDGK